MRRFPESPERPCLRKVIAKTPGEREARSWKDRKRAAPPDSWRTLFLLETGVVVGDSTSGAPSRVSGFLSHHPPCGFHGSGAGRERAKGPLRHPEQAPKAAAPSSPLPRRQPFKNSPPPRCCGALPRAWKGLTAFFPAAARNFRTRGRATFSARLLGQRRFARERENGRKREREREQRNEKEGKDGGGRKVCSCPGQAEEREKPISLKDPRPSPGISPPLEARSSARARAHTHPAASPCQSKQGAGTARPGRPPPRSSSRRCARGTFTHGALAKKHRHQSDLPARRCSAGCALFFSL